MMMIENKYDFKQIVYLVTDDEQLPRMVTCIKIFPNDILYGLSCGTIETSHYEFEISLEKSFVNNVEKEIT